MIFIWGWEIWSVSTNKISSRVPGKTRKVLNFKHLCTILVSEAAVTRSQENRASEIKFLQYTAIAFIVTSVRLVKHTWISLKRKQCCTNVTTALSVSWRHLKSFIDSKYWQCIASKVNVWLVTLQPDIFKYTPRQMSEILRKNLTESYSFLQWCYSL